MRFSSLLDSLLSTYQWWKYPSLLPGQLQAGSKLTGKKIVTGVGKHQSLQFSKEFSGSFQETAEEVREACALLRIQFRIGYNGVGWEEHAFD